ncbi:nuclear transport factor 2 family protein [Pseudomonas putida]|uniref:Nuclear transport factor 2 family protein n=1 Tax=Pseudomonas putida TaxID=303 RepID=A0AAW6PTU0_PSEPU|nr:nuclear transport factor 2 family protein [Pseudomonas putida]MDF3872855.1 nuclear transport factor 2 family protein [Pseudomonas putida]MDF3878192.1 nuclear transport factor 2 family protein [Pseudomonas putida]
MSNEKKNISCEVACSRLIADFAHYVDSKEYESLVALFTEDGSFERRGEVLKGRAAILEAMRARPADVVTRHVCTNIRIDQVASNSAVGTCTLLLFHGSAAQGGGSTESSSAVTIAEYRDTFVATQNGWQIAARIAHVIF